jgi:preprotein translocase subunit SecA
LESEYFLEENEIGQLIDSIGTLFILSDEHKDKIRDIEIQAGDAEFALNDYLGSLAEQRYDEKEKQVEGQTVNLPSGEITFMHQLERLVCLQNLDTIWMQHLDTMSHLRDSVGLRGYGQRDPLVEYKREGYEIFQRALAEIEKGIASTIYKVGINIQQQPTPIQMAAQNSSNSSGFTNADGSEVGRNDPCPCGSGKKWKKCGMLNTPEHRANAAKGTSSQQRIGG